MPVVLAALGAAALAGIIVATLATDFCCSPSDPASVADSRGDTQDVGDMTATSLDRPVAAETMERLQSTGLGDWAEAASDASESVTAGRACSDDFVPLSQELFDAAVQLPDVEMAELILNLDASMRSFQSACAEVDDATMELEALDMSRTAERIGDRLLLFEGE